MKSLQNDPHFVEHHLNIILVNTIIFGRKFCYELSGYGSKEQKERDFFREKFGNQKLSWKKTI
jgi:hypothetical protein